MIALAVASTAQGLANANKQAKAVTKKGAQEAERGKQLTLARAGKQKASFLSSGITLESGTVQAVLGSTFDVGKADIEAGISNANRRARNIIGAAQTKALMTLASTSASASSSLAGKPMSGAQTNPFQGITKTGAAPTGGSSFGSGIF